MSTHRFIPANRKGRSLPLLSMLGGLLIALQLLLTPVAFAASSRANVTPPLTQPGIVNLAGVSVVRLFISYQIAKPISTVTCTELGTIIASWPANSPTEPNNWVLTDGAILSPTGGSCQPGSKLALSGIQVIASNEYTGQPVPSLIGQLVDCNGTSCTDAQSNTSTSTEVITKPINGGVLFSFHSDSSHTMQPYLSLEPSTATLGTTGIELTSTAETWPTTPLTKPTDSTVYLTPNSSTITPGSAASSGSPTPRNTVATTPTSEPGMPYVDSNGNLTGMQLFGQTTHLTVTDIQNLEKQQPVFAPSIQFQHTRANTLNTGWDAGIRQYDQNQFHQAAQTFQSIKTLNPAFQAASAFATIASQKAAQQKTATPTPSPTVGSGTGTGSTTFLGIPTSLLLLIGLVAGVLVLILLFVLVSLVFGRKRLERKRELDAMDEEAARARQKVDRMETPSAPAPQQAQQPQPQAFGGANYPTGAVSDLRCPNCHAAVEENAPYCPNCRYVFSPSASGLHRFAMPPSPLAPAQAQPQEALAAPPPARPLSEAPTVDMSHKNGGFSPESEITMPFDVQQLHGRNLGLAVITETNPGIKRKHKPNEDSLFAIQGERTHNSLPQQFGLFVVADGMGGHANGQDASRVAIQNIIDFMLPRISTGNNLNDDGYKNLLMEGVQHANLAVHQRNLEEHADMGTTMTAALVVGATAYVANVGDSRTYLYREPEGLRQITHDHSVVASLVDAGIIKPDDIYTHPKRNQIYRSLGEKPAVEVDVFMQSLQPNDKLLLCSDGLWDMVRDPEIQRVIGVSMPTPTQIGKNLVKAALDGGGEDNVSVIVVSITETAGHTGMTGIHLHAKPDSVTVPNLPNINIR